MNAKPFVASGASRRFDIDHLRNAAVLLLIVFHSARLFDAEDWHIKDAGRYQAADLLVRGLNLMSMPLLFLVAGASIAWSMRTRSAAAFARERLARLLLPLAAGCVLFVLPQVWIERQAIGAPGRSSPIDFDGGLLAFVPRFFECCYPQANFSWHHLWFLAYLFSYSLALLPLLAIARRPLAQQVLARSAGWVNTAPRLLLLGLPLLAAEVALRSSYPSTHALAGDWANHAHYGLLVVLGWWLARSERPFAAAAAAWPMLAGATLVLTLLWLDAPRWAGALAPGWRGSVLLVVRVAGEWFWIATLLGLAWRHLDRPTWLTPFSRYAMPFYVIHQAVIVALGGWWLGWAGQPALKYFAVAGLSAATTMLLCLLFERAVPMRWLLGMKPAPAAGRSAARRGGEAAAGGRA